MLERIVDDSTTGRVEHTPRMGNFLKGDGDDLLIDLRVPYFQTNPTENFHGWPGKVSPYDFFSCCCSRTRMNKTHFLLVSLLQ